ncbi:hypothetical protein F0562_033115 [Nyssa sinensis]|uniref:Thioredoxin domain-containing protein n=1 Tax=Nyssa sinensis TaxID=561372 RepID=A0A5J5AUF8_9ASTE|nr:hypothetical protein F0562_033115 [Nyssa sinensis]
MRNSDSDTVAATSSSSLSWTTLVVLAFLVLSSSSIRTVDSESDGGKLVQWQILTKQNFSSQIRLQPHLLLMVTVPWSGESRSLMKELAHVVTNKQENFGTLKLMLLYRSIERMLADALGATEGITILYFHQSLAYKYQGRLRAQNILSSVHFVMSHFPKEIPLKSLNTPKDLKIFLESTDKALLLLEFCGWTPRLLVKRKNNGTESAFEGLSGTGLDGETDRALAAEGKKNQKRIENEKMKCGIGSEFTRIPWLGEFSPVNDSAFLEDENMRPGDGLSCSFEEFQRFESFFTKFMTVVREFSLPPERLRFGLVSKRSLLSSLGVGDSSSWLTMLYFVGCPSCSKVLREGDDLKNVLQMHNSLVTELEGDGHDLEPSLPANKPSILLFIDRSSDSLRTRRKSKEALNVFRDLALRCQMAGQNNAKPVKSSVEAYQAWRSTSQSRRLEMPPTSQKITLKNKMSIMITNNGKHVTLDDIASDLKASSLHEILAYALQHKKEVKLSSLAREAGFQLLSDDFDIKIAEALPARTEIVQSNQVAAELPMEDLKSSVDLKKDQIPYADGKSDMGYEEQSKPTYGETPEYNDEKISYRGTNTQFSAELDQSHTNQVLASAEDGNVEQKTNPQLEKSEEQQLHVKGFRGSFFFSDGGYRLLKALTVGSKIPAVVIIDPSLQQHYVLPEETIFSYSSLSDFLDGFLNGSLLPYQRSESIVQSRREAPIPPFVNLDFHEVGSIPRVTTHTFSEMVLGFNQSDTTNADHAWKTDVLVLFSNNWCGFCQRMELVVREVYWALKGYANILKNGSRNEKSVLSSDDLKDNLLKLPLIYFMDCTLNDCSLILRSMAQRELYPALLLFPAERKNTVSYEGDMAVLDIIKFIADHGSNSQSLVGGKGNLWAGVEQGSRNQKSYKEALQTAVHKEAPLAREKYHEVLLKNRTPKVEVRYNWIRPQKSNGLHGTAPQVRVGSILHSTDRLLNVRVFDKSIILIVKADQGTGFQGLIINKHISWDALHELEEGLEQLKEAPLSFGGPVVKRGMLLVALTRRVFKVQYPEILPNLYFLDQEATIHEIEGFKLGNQSVTDYWFFLGYSSWDWDQLFHEIAEGAWNISNGNTGLLDWPWR